MGLGKKGSGKRNNVRLLGGGRVGWNLEGIGRYPPCIYRTTRIEADVQYVPRNPARRLLVVGCTDNGSAGPSSLEQTVIRASFTGSYPTAEIGHLYCNALKVA